MSNSSMPVPDGRIPGVPPEEALRQTVQQTAETVRPAVRFAGFWLAVALPLLHLPLLLHGLEGSEFHVFLGLFLANVLALLAGHNYAR